MKEHLTDLQYKVLRLGHTEPGGSGRLLYQFGEGDYRCAGCGSLLFYSHQKYDSGTGWPSFHGGMENALEYRDDPLHGMKRLEVLCAGCKGHLGHLFDDLDSPTERRFCINSASLEFIPRT